MQLPSRLHGSVLPRALGTHSSPAAPVRGSVLPRALGTQPSRQRPPANSRQAQLGTTAPQPSPSARVRLVAAGSSYYWVPAGLHRRNKANREPCSKTECQASPYSQKVVYRQLIDSLSLSLSLCLSLSLSLSLTLFLSLSRSVFALLCLRLGL